MGISIYVWWGGWPLHVAATRWRCQNGNITVCVYSSLYLNGPAYMYHNHLNSDAYTTLGCQYATSALEL